MIGTSSLVPNWHLWRLEDNLLLTRYERKQVGFRLPICRGFTKTGPDPGGRTAGIYRSKDGSISEWTLTRFKNGAHP